MVDLGRTAVADADALAALLPNCSRLRSLGGQSNRDLLRGLSAQDATAARHAKVRGRGGLESRGGGGGGS